MKEVHFLEGEWLVADDMKISAFDLGITRGLAVFDTLRTYHSKPFVLDRHLKRFRESAAVLSIELKYSDEQITSLILDGIEKNQMKEAVIRLNLSAGINEGFLSSTKPIFSIMFFPLSLPPKEKYLNGQSLKSIQINRTLPQIKTVNYVSAKLGLLEAGKVGADEALYVDSQGNMLETTISNIFFWKGGKLFTPPPDNILPGITRQLVKEVAKLHKIEYTESDININELKTFDEAFACSSIKEILAITKIDNIGLSNGKIGPQTKNITSIFKEFSEKLSS
jgi:branched-chain amino acid aminotransferase